MAHAMTEFAFDLFYGKYRSIQSKSASNFVSWIDKAIKKVESQHLQKSKKNKLERPTYYETEKFIIPEDGRIEIADMDVYRWRRIEDRKHKFNIVIDPTITIVDSISYDKAGIRINAGHIPESIMQTIRTRVYSKANDNPVYLSDIITMNHDNVSIPKLKISSIASGTDDDIWLEMEESWEPWETMKTRIIRKHK